MNVKVCLLIPGSRILNFTSFIFLYLFRCLDHCGLCAILNIFLDMEPVELEETFLSAILDFSMLTESRGGEGLGSSR